MWKTVLSLNNRYLVTEDLPELDSFTEHDSGEEEQNDTLSTAQTCNFLNF
jgi:hypothetical protein